MRIAVFALVLLFTVPVAAEDTTSLEELLASFGYDLATTEIRTEKLGEGLYVLFGVGGNIGVSIGADGVLVVDDQFPEMVPKVRAAIEALGGGPIDYAINTHWHFDHAEGNLALGPAGTTLVSHSNARGDMARGGIINLVRTRYQQQPYPPDALPVITFDGRMQLHWNGEQIDLLHAGPAHTTGDTAVIFHRHQAVHLGDVFNNTGYPFIDVDSGGSIDGMIAFCQAVLAELPADAVVIPGHGPVTDRATLEAYVAMLASVRARVAALIAKGKTLEEVVAARVTAEHEERYGEESRSIGFVDRVYTSLTRSGTGR
jgi:cyclase